MSQTATSKRPRFLARLRLRHKLSLSLSVAALLPVLVVGLVAGRVVLDSLDLGIREDTDRQLDVGLLLTVRRIERITRDAERVADSSDLAEAMDVPEEASSPAEVRRERDDRVRRFIDRMSPHLDSSLLQVFDVRGQLVYRKVIGGVSQRFQDLAVDRTSESVRAGLRSSKHMSFEPVGDRLVVRATAPILDPSFRLRGVVVVSVPLDRSFAQAVKGELGTDVLIFSGVGDRASPAQSSFLDSRGSAAQPIALDAESAARLAAGQSARTGQEIVGRWYTVAYAPLNDLDGEPVGALAVAVDRASLAAAKQVATRSLMLGAIGAVFVALLLASVLARRLSRSISRLHRGAKAVTRGDLEYQIEVSEGDEIGDLATAFANMTRALKENRERLAARINEITALHGAARAVSSVIDLDQVLKTIVDSAAGVLDVRLCALWLVEERSESPADESDQRRDQGSGRVGGFQVRLGAARVKPKDMSATMHGDEGAQAAEPLLALALDVARTRRAVRVDDIADQTSTRKAALAAGVTGSLLGLPLVRGEQVVGVIVVGRTRDVIPFSDADADLLTTFADQASSAVANARLYEEVRAFNEELEAKVRVRTAELTAANGELEKTLRELRETQAQLISSERLAGLGLLVASVAHEINSPSAAIAGSVDALDANVAQLVSYTHQLSALALPAAEERAVADYVTQVAPVLAAKPLGSGAKTRRAARALRGRFEEIGLAADVARRAAGILAELGAGEDVIGRFLEVLARDPSRADDRASVMLGYLHEHALTIRNAIRRVQRIVGALKSYSHLDQQASLIEADVHEGIDDTLVILDYVLRDIRVIRQYGTVPRIPIYVDQLNQVWTNLIQNAVQALEGQGQITIETGVEDDGVAVRIIDNGPGIPAEARPKIFESFFTTKPKGEGTGLGLGIVRQIVEKKHEGQVTCESEPGRTCFLIWLPRTPSGAHSPERAADSVAALESNTLSGARSDSHSGAHSGANAGTISEAEQPE